MPKQLVTLTPGELSDILSAVMGQNGHDVNPADIELMHEGQSVTFDQVQISMDNFYLQVRDTPEEKTPTLRDIMQARYQRYVSGGFALDLEREKDEAERN